MEILACRKLWLHVVKANSWAWDSAALPFVGIGNFMVPIEGAIVLKLVPISFLLGQGCRALASLDHFLACADRDFGEALVDLQDFPFIPLTAGQACWVPPGFVAFISACEVDGHKPVDGKASCAIFFVFDEGIKDKMTTKVWLAVKAYVYDNINTYGETKTWRTRNITMSPLQAVWGRPGIVC